MKFERKKITEQVKSILKMNDKETAINRIVEMIETEHKAKEHFRYQRDNALIELQDRKDAGY